MYWLRFNLDLKEPHPSATWSAWTLAWIVPLQAGDLPGASASTAACGGSRAWSTCSGSCSAAGLGAVLVPLVLVMLQLQAVVPRSVLIFYPIVLIFLMAGNRFAYRIWKEHRLYSPFAALGEPVLIVGAGEAGARLSQGTRAQPAMARRRPARRRPVEARPPAAQRRRAGPDLRPARVGGEVRRAQGDHRAAVGGARRAPPRRRDLRATSASRR